MIKVSWQPRAASAICVMPASREWVVMLVSVGATSSPGFVFPGVG
jgi:hypothetical protein